MSGADEPIRLAVADVARIGGHGLRSRPTRVLLSALGIAIGVAAMMAVLGISASSKAEVGRRLDRLGTNLLRVTPGRDATGEAASLPASAPRMISRIGPVTAVSAVGAVPVGVYRSDHVPSGRTSSVIVLAADTSVLATLGGSMSVGHWLSGPSQAFPTVVLGAAAADRLDTHELGTRLWLGRTWATVVGILQPLDLASELDQAALVGWDAARDYLGFDGSPSTVYLRATESQIGAVTDVLARTANPRSPGEVSVSRPSDALAARAATDSTLTALLLGLGGVALLVGGIGVANTMVISVLERRSEIGLRRALGATRRQIQAQFVTESLILSALGGLGGVTLGALVTIGYAVHQGWPWDLPPWAALAGVGLTVLVGVIAGLYPASRASRTSPTAALSAS